MGTSDEIVYTEINKADIVNTIYCWQYKFYEKFRKLRDTDSIAKSIWQKYKQMDDNLEKPFLNHYESLKSDTVKSNIEMRKSIIRESKQTMHKRYYQLFNLKYNEVLYNSMTNDMDRVMITRWRLSSHRLYIETGRYKNPPIIRDQRTCIICEELEDEEHAIFKCKAHRCIRNRARELISSYPDVKSILSPYKVEVIRQIAKYLKDIEQNMDKLKMIR